MTAAEKTQISGTNYVRMALLQALPKMRHEEGGTALDPSPVTAAIPHLEPTRSPPRQKRKWAMREDEGHRVSMRDMFASKSRV
jgi:hypothetical protein